MYGMEAWRQQLELNWLQRPARRQVDESTIKREEARSAGSHNVWSGRSLDRPAGERGERGRQRKERSLYRCRPEVDVGRTRGSDAEAPTFCLYFSKGCCAQGSSCIYLHRLPTKEDDEYHRKNMAADIFGREKRAEAEGYRKGAGTFERDNRTLFVNYEGAGSYDLPKIRRLLEENFHAWGPVKRIHIVFNKTLAFVEYEWRSSAEFAKEAMHKQGLLGSSQGEVLALRWANEDPNPTAVVATKRAHMDTFEKAAMASWDALPEEQKQARIQQLQMAQALKKGRVIANYPSTDSQYEQQQQEGGHDEGAEGQYPDTNGQYAGCESGYASTEHMTPEQYAEYCAQYWAYYGHQGGGDAAAAAQGSAHESGQEPGEGNGEGDGNALALLAGYGSGSDEDDAQGEQKGQGQETGQEGS